MPGCGYMGERKEELLRCIVEEYIKTFNPIPSKDLVEKFGCSSATIRNDMAELEKLGYLEKEHTSSGRIPSEKGYKYYVDNLMKPKELTGEDVLKLQTILNNNQLVISDAVQQCMEIISDITHYTSVVIGPNKNGSTLKQISIIPLEDAEDSKRVLAILVTNQGLVENKQFNIASDIDLQELLKTCKRQIQSVKIPVVANNYFVELSEANEAILEIIKELAKKHNIDEEKFNKRM